MTKRGLYLQGGGTKGAYQAGVLSAFSERKVQFEAISSTSIGSITGYFVATNQFDELKYEWLNMIFPDSETTEDGLFFNNEFLLDILKKYSVKNLTVNHWYVNYAVVNNQLMENRYEDLIDSSSEDRLKYIDYSSKLPIRDENKKFDLNLYEGMNIDGGLINNAFVEPLLDLDFDEIIVIPLNNEFDESKFKMFKGKVTVMYPPKSFKPGDTTKIDKKFISEWFKIGYEEGMKMKHS
ncbi:MAG: patatin-like phospholipase family protein [Bacillota bacterium]|nr:patatin-like phospholipase family protein [Bacillota bacterium]